MFRYAIVRRPGANFAEGLTTVDLGRPVYAKALEQHLHYCQTLQHCGLALTELAADSRYPDSTFVEDTAVLTERGAILTRPGALSREGEVASIQTTLAQFYPAFHVIAAPATLDGGDICEADDHFFIGISDRTNAAGAQQLAGFLSQAGYTSTCVDIRDTTGMLHLKSGLAYLGNRRLVLIDALAKRPEFRGYEIVPVAPEENYAANCVRVNDHVLIAEGFPKFKATLQHLKYRLLALDMSEFQKMDGGLSCLSLRF